MNDPQQGSAAKQNHPRMSNSNFGMLQTHHSSAHAPPKTKHNVRRGISSLGFGRRMVPLSWRDEAKRLPGSVGPIYVLRCSSYCVVSVTMIRITSIIISRIITSTTITHLNLVGRCWGYCYCALHDKTRNGTSNLGFGTTSVPPAWRIRPNQRTCWHFGR